MPPYRTTRPVAELDAGLGDDLSTADGRSLAVSLIAVKGGGTDIVVRDRITGRVVEDIAPEKVEAVVKAHKRQPPAPQPTPEKPGPAPGSQPAPRALAFPPVAPATGKSFL